MPPPYAATRTSRVLLSCKCECTAFDAPCELSLFARSCGQPARSHHSAIEPAHSRPAGLRLSRTFRAATLTAPPAHLPLLHALVHSSCLAPAALRSARSPAARGRAPTAPSLTGRGRTSAAAVPHPNPIRTPSAPPVTILALRERPTPLPRLQHLSRLVGCARQLLPSTAAVRHNPSAAAQPSERRAQRSLVHWRWRWRRKQRERPTNQRIAARARVTATTSHCNSATPTGRSDTAPSELNSE